MPLGTVEKKSAPIEQEEQKKQKEQKNKRKLDKFQKFIIIYISIILLLNVIARLSSSACDFYANHIFWIASETYSRFSGIFPFSFGELLAAIGILILLVLVITSILLIFLRKKPKYKKFAFSYLKTTLVIALSVAMLYTLNCTILYGSSKMDFSNSTREFDIDTLEEVRNMVVNKCIELSEQMEREDDGTLIFNGNFDKSAAEALHGISNKFPRLKGYYPPTKELWCSYYMFELNTIGVYFPFSMEANYSKFVSDSYMPNVLAHEYAHLKGYIYEDEANFISFLACINSDDKAVEYSGYLSVLWYIDDDYSHSVPEERYNKQPQIPDIVNLDNNCYDQKTIQQLIKLQHENLDKYGEITDAIVDFSYDATDLYNDFVDYTPNYNEVSLLMMQYYNEYHSFNI